MGVESAVRSPELFFSKRKPHTEGLPLPPDAVLSGWDTWNHRGHVTTRLREKPPLRHRGCWKEPALWWQRWAAEPASPGNCPAPGLSWAKHELNIYLRFMSWGFGVLLLKASCLILWVYLRDFSLHKENPDVRPMSRNQALAGSEVGLWWGR